MTEINIKEAHERDIQAITDIERRSFPMPWPEEALRGYIDTDGRICLIAKIDGKTVGYLSAFFVLDEYHIGSVAVSPEARRTGVGRELVSELIRRARSQSGQYVFLEVRRSNFAARKLYTALGFTEAASRRNYYDLPKEDAILMTLYL